MRLLLAAAMGVALISTDFVVLPADAAPSAPTQETLAGPTLVTPIVTRAGVAHRSARRTSRRVYRRHAY